MYREVSQSDEKGNDEELSERFACHLILNQLPWHSSMTLACFDIWKRWVRVMIYRLWLYVILWNILSCIAHRHPIVTSVVLPDADAGVVSLGGAKDLFGEHHRGCGAACNGAERALPSLQPRLLQQQRLHLFALPTWNPLRWHQR